MVILSTLADFAAQAKNDELRGIAAVGNKSKRRITYIS